ncbi:PREDICTED: uncharacterized protein LOC105953540 [Erythranthe guttata]|nr:PREDICTED: uncharacterized protein LOC105953540 [Erythranthe guttata]|eukprot:XP_012832668.1 PREDICTED: uncharacterized protein LOC105953540 [Erythranthe guttata]
MFWGSKRKKTSTNIGSLPEDLVFEILLRLPAEDIYKTAILVCKKWHNAIHSCNFVHKHLQHSAPVLLAQLIDHGDDRDYGFHQLNIKRFLPMGRGSVEESEFSYDTMGRVLGSCNGLILECLETEDRYNLSIVNPVRFESFDLPSISPEFDIAYDPMIAYAEASNKYKVVVMGFWKFEPTGIESCVMLTVGVDKSWRRVDTKHLDIDRCLSTQRFIHWTRSEGTCIANLNVETEIVTETRIPQGYEKRFKYYLSMGSCLTLLVECVEFSWEVLKMKPETGEWTRMLKIDLEPLKGKFVNLVWKCVSPIGWLNEKMLALRIFSPPVCVLYNVRTQEIESLELERPSDDYFFNVHRDSLIW